MRQIMISGILEQFWADFFGNFVPNGPCNEFSRKNEPHPGICYIVPELLTKEPF